MLQEQIKLFRCYIGSCFWTIKIVAPIMVLCRHTLPSVNSLCSVGGSNIWVDIKYCSCAWWGHRETIPVVSVDVELMICLFSGVNVRRVKSVAGDDSLLCRFIPQLEWQFNICGA